MTVKLTRGSEVYECTSESLRVKYPKPSINLNWTPGYTHELIKFFPTINDAYSRISNIDYISSSDEEFLSTSYELEYFEVDFENKLSQYIRAFITWNDGYENLQFDTQWDVTLLNRAPWINSYILKTETCPPGLNIDAETESGDLIFIYSLYDELGDLVYTTKEVDENFHAVLIFNNKLYKLVIVIINEFDLVTILELDIQSDTDCSVTKVIKELIKEEWTSEEVITYIDNLTDDVKNYIRIRLGWEYEQVAPILKEFIYRDHINFRLKDESVIKFKIDNDSPIKLTIDDDKDLGLKVEKDSPIKLKVESSTKNIKLRIDKVVDTLKGC
jgi:hypothetical protein